MNDGEDINTEGEIPSRWVSEFLQIEDTAIELLEELLTVQLSESENHAQDRIRTLHNRKPAVFQTIFLALNGNEDYFDDVEEQMGQQVRKKLTDIRDRFSLLEKDFMIVRQEENEGRINPIKSYRTFSTFEYESDVPLVGIRFKSGSFIFPDIQDQPSRILQIGLMSIDSVNDAFERVLYEDYQIPEGESEDMQEVIENIEQQLNQLKNNLNEQE